MSRGVATFIVFLLFYSIAPVSWIVIPLFLGFAILVFFYELARIITRNINKEVDELKELLDKSRKKEFETSQERDQLQRDNSQLIATNMNLRNQLVELPKIASFVNSRPTADGLDDVIRWGMLIHQQYINQITSPTPPPKRLWSRDFMVESNILTFDQWNEGMRVLRDSGIAVKVSDGNNSRTIWKSENAQIVESMLRSHVDKARR